MYFLSSLVWVHIYLFLKWWFWITDIFFMNSDTSGVLCSTCAKDTSSQISITINFYMYNWLRDSNRSGMVAVKACHG